MFLTKILLIPAIMGSLFTMCQGGPVPKGCCTHNDRLDVVMTQPDWVKTCNNWGGEPIQYPNGIRVCEGVDF